MSHKRQDTLAPSAQSSDHLKAYGKRLQAKAERSAAKVDMRQRLDETDAAQPPESLPSLAKPKKHRKQWKLQRLCGWTEKEWHTAGTYTTETRTLQAAEMFRHQGWTIRLISPTGEIKEL